MQVKTTRAAWAAGLGMAAVLAAGCGNSATGNGNATSSPSAHAMPAADVMKLAADQASQTNSVSADLSMRMSGQQPGSMQGSVKIRIRPSLAMDMNMTQAAFGGQSLPGGMREILSSQGLYMHLSQLAQQTGKPWVLIPESALNKETGNAFGQLAQQAQQQNPLSSAQMLAAAQNVKQIGTGTVAGVAVTRYSGVISVQEALTKVNGQLRKVAQQQFSSLGVTTIPFTAAVDQQHQIRQVNEQINGTSEQVSTTFTITGLNQPVSITPPPASEVTTLPASALSGSGG